MSVIVCNAGPLIALAGVSSVALLHHLFGEVHVAEEVKDEVEAGGTSGIGKDIFREHSWLLVTRLAAPVNPTLSSLLDPGEAATITLAHDLNASLVLLDEAKGRKIAGDAYHLPVIGTGRILVECQKARTDSHCNAAARSNAHQRLLDQHDRLFANFAHGR